MPLPFALELPSLPALLGPAVGAIAILAAIAYARLRAMRSPR